MIIVCEPICDGLVHVPVNAALLEIIREAYPHKKIAFFGEMSHIQYIRSQIGPSLSPSILWNDIRLPPRFAKFSSRLIPELKIINRLLKVALNNTCRYFVFTSVTPSMLYGLKFFLRLMNRQALIQLVMHGGLSSLTGWRSRNPFLRLTDLKSALTLGGNKRIQYIILEESIKEKLLSLLPSLQNNVAVLDHPLPPEEYSESAIPLKSPFFFGFLGLATKEKGFDCYLNIASEVKKTFPGRAKFHAIGQILPEHQSEFEMSVLDSPPQQTKLIRELYVKQVKKLHFVCFPYERGHYELSPSGALLDAIVFGKPFIASRLPIFETLFDRYGDIGYLFDVNTEFFEIIQKIIEQGDTTRYMTQVRNLQKLRKARSLETLTLKYQNICSTLFQQYINKMP